MPSYQAPRSDEGRLAFIETSITTATDDIAKGRKSITPETLAALKAFAATFRPLYDALTGALTGRMKEIREREDVRANLDTWVRDFWEVLRRRAHRLQQPVEILAYYGLPADGTNPDITTFEALVQAADTIVKGDAKAVADGFPAMQNPAAAEIVPILADARRQAADVPTADRTYTEAQQAIAAQRTEGDLRIDDVMNDLRSSLRRYDAPTQRRIMRGYGAEFVPLPGEPADPEPAPAPTPAAATTTPATPTA